MTTALLAALGLITVAGLILRLVRIGDQPLWLDEAASLHYARQSLGTIWSAADPIDESNPPLYYALLHFWLWFGESETALRVLSAVIGALVIPVTFFLGRTVSGDRVAILAAALVAASPIGVQYGQEARVYTLLALLSGVSMLGVASLLNRWSSDVRVAPEGPRTVTRTAGRRGLGRAAPWAAYVIATGLALLSHNTAVFLFAGANLVVVGWLWKRRALRSRLPGWIAAQVGVLAIWAVWIPGLVYQTGLVYEGFWIPPPGIRQIRDAAQAMYAAGILMSFPEHIAFRNLAAFMLALAVGAIGLVAVRDLARRSPRWLWFLLVFSLSAPIGELLVSMWRPIFRPPSLIWASIPVLLLFGRGIMAIRNPLRVASLGLMLVASAWGVLSYLTLYQKESWDQAAAYIAQHAANGDVILLNSSAAELPFAYYVRRFPNLLPRYGLPSDLPARGWPEARMSAADIPRVSERIAGHSRVWLLYSHDIYTDPDRLIARTLDAGGRRIDARSFTGIDLFLYEVAVSRRTETGQ